MREHTYHLDRGSHSITVALHAHEIELLVDGRTVDLQPPPQDEDALLHGELPGDPPRPFEVRLARRHHKADEHPLCTLDLDGQVEVVPERMRSWN